MTLSATPKKKERINKIEFIHFSSHRLQICIVDTLESQSSSIWHVFSSMLPQNLHEQYRQCHFPEGNFCSAKIRADYPQAQLNPYKVYFHI